MTVEVIVTAKAEALIDAIDLFWSEGQPDTRTLFRDELDRALQQLAILPASGPIYLESPIANTHRVLLRKSQYYVYYEWTPTDAQLFVICVWGCQRGEPPDLSSV
jgi:hypothetical protein